MRPEVFEGLREDKKSHSLPGCSDGSVEAKDQETFSLLLDGD